MFGVVRTNDVVSFNIGTSLERTAEVISQSVKGEIGSQFTEIVVIHTNAFGEIGVKEKAKAYRLSIIPATIQTFQSPSRKKRLKTFAKKVLLQARDNP